MLSLGLPPAARAQVCTGDCSGNSLVGLDELIFCVNVGLDRFELAECPACDGTGGTGGGPNGALQIDDLVRAVQNSLDPDQLDECNAVPDTPTRTPTPTNTQPPGATSTPTHTPTNTSPPTATDTAQPTATDTAVEATATDTPAATATPTDTPMQTATDTPIASPTCGDGNTDPGEQCDDGRNCANGTACDEDGDCNVGSCLPRSGDGCQNNCMLPVCGDGIVDNQGVEISETCDDGNTTEGFGDDCPANCRVRPCDLSDLVVPADVVFDTDPEGLEISGLELFVRYPDGSVDVAGMNNDPAVQGSVTSENFTVTANDRDFAIDLVLLAIPAGTVGVPVGTAGVTAGTAATIAFRLCAGGPLPVNDDFTCDVHTASDADLNDVTDQVSCSVVLGEIPPTPTPTNTVEPTATNTPEPTPTVTDTPAVPPTNTPSPSPTATQANTSTPTRTETATPTVTSASTSTNTPTSTPTPTATTPPSPCPIEAGIYTNTQTAGGMLAVDGLTPFPFPAGGQIIQHVSAATQPNCVHETVVPATGGFSAPLFCIPGLNFSVQVQQNGCGVGRIDSNGGSDFTITETGDTSSPTVCGLPASNCLTPPGDSNVQVNVQVGGNGADVCGSGTANAAVSVPVHTITWSHAPLILCQTVGPDSTGPGGPGDSTVTEFDQILDFTTDTTSADWSDLDPDGCCLAGAGPGSLQACAFGGGGGGPFTETGTCLDLTGANVAGPDVTTVAAGTIGSNGSPLYDLTFSTTLPNEVSGPVGAPTATCATPPVITFSPPGSTAMRCIP